MRHSGDEMRLPPSHVAPSNLASSAIRSQRFTGAAPERQSDVAGSRIPIPEREVGRSQLRVSSAEADPMLTMASCTAKPSLANTEKGIEYVKSKAGDRRIRPAPHRPPFQIPARSAGSPGTETSSGTSIATAASCSSLISVTPALDRNCGSKSAVSFNRLEMMS